MSENRDFKGVWIPKEIWLNEELTLLEKVIFVEIDSLDNENHCVASNQYFASFCDCSESKITKAIKKLKDLEMIEEVSFDGRHRILRVVKSTRQDHKKYEAGSQKVRTNNISNTQKDNKSKNSIINNTIVESGKFLGSANKKPRESLYAKVQSSVKAISTDVAIQNALLDFFDLQIEIYREEGKQYYFNIWKSRLNKLQNEFDRKDWLKVIQQSVSQGWKNFYPLKDYSKSLTQKEKPWEKGVRSDKYTREEKEEMERWQKEMRQQGVKVDF